MRMGSPAFFIWPIVLLAVVLSGCEEGLSEAEFADLTSRLETMDAGMAEADALAQTLADEVERLTELQAPDAGKLVAEAQEVFDAMSEAVSSEDTDVFYALLASDITDRCTPEQVTEDFGADDFMPGLRVASVYVDVADRDLAFARLEIDMEEGADDIAGLATGLLAAFPWPMAFEGDGWKLSIPFVPPGEECPFGASGTSSGLSSEETQVAKPAPSPLEAPGIGFTDIEPPSGAIVVGQAVSGGDRGGYVQLTLDSDLDAAALLAHYRAVAEADWTMVDEATFAQAAVAVWELPDGGGERSYVTLTVSPDGDSFWAIQLSVPGELARVSVEPVPTPAPSPPAHVPAPPAATRIPDQGIAHILPRQEHPPYNSVPATSGWHYGQPYAPAPWGTYEEFIPDEILVHNLEHGGVGIHYDCPDGCPVLVAELSAIALDAGRVVLSPYPGMGVQIALTAWNYIDRLDAFDRERIEAFIGAHMDSGHAPESGVP